MAPVQSLDISGNPVGSTNTINSWVSTQTAGQIPNLLSTLDSSTALVLVNAITFNDRWLKPFATKSNGDFHLSNAVTIQACKMRMACPQTSRKHGIVPGLDSHIVELKYEQNDMSMYIIRPNQKEGLAYLEYNLDLTTLNIAINGMTPKQVNVILPKFSLTQNVDLIEYLQGMGMSDVFSDTAADLSGLGAGSLYVGFVQHQAIIKVNLEGTEASGATAVGVCYARRRRRQVLPVQFDVDRPFIYLIRENTSGSILFMGRVTNPESSCPTREIIRLPSSLSVATRG